MAEPARRKLNRKNKELSGEISERVLESKDGRPWSFLHPAYGYPLKKDDSALSGKLYKHTLQVC